MRLRIAVVVAVASLAFLVGWSFSGSVAAQADPEPEVDPTCHYEIYGPVGENWSFNDRSVREPIILLNQCTGTSWRLDSRSSTRGTWYRLRVSRN